MTSQLTIDQEHDVIDSGYMKDDHHFQLQKRAATPAREQTMAPGTAIPALELDLVA